MIRVLWYVLCLILLLVRMVSMYRTTTEKKKVGVLGPTFKSVLSR